MGGRRGQPLPPQILADQLPYLDQGGHNIPTHYYLIFDPCCIPELDTRNFQEQVTKNCSDISLFK